MHRRASTLLKEHRSRMARNWRQFPARLKQEATSASSFASIASAGLVAAGVVLTLPTVGVLSAIVCAAATAWSVAKAIPPQLESREHYVNVLFTDLTLLDRLTPEIDRIGIVGVSRAGKSTLLDSLLVRPKRMETTERPYATVAVLPSVPAKYYALVDAAGQQYSQQFKIVDNTDYLIIVLDHNSSDASSDLDSSRQEEHDLFLKQLMGHFRNTSRIPKGLHFLLNKSDLWSKDEATSQPLKKWFESKVSTCSHMPIMLVTKATHTNLDTAAIACLVEHLRVTLR